MAITVIVELRAKPGRRDELKGVLESLIATQGPGQDGFLGSIRYGVLDDPDVLVEIADWESAAAREAHMHEAAAFRRCSPFPVQPWPPASRGWQGGQHRRRPALPALPEP